MRQKLWDTVGESRRAGNFALYMASLNIEEPRKSRAEISALED
jgi:hypothetical protein